MSYRVVVADDVGFIREMLINFSHSAGYQVVGEARTGLEAWEISVQRKPDILFLDLIMPGLNGAMVAHKLSETHPHIYIIAVSSAEEPFILQKSFNSGCRDFLKKPFSKEDVHSCFQRYVKHLRGDKHA